MPPTSPYRLLVLSADSTCRPALQAGFTIVDSLTDNPDCIIADEAAQAKKSAWPDVPVIMLTAPQDVSSPFFLPMVASSIERDRLQKELVQSGERFHEFTHQLAHDLKSPLRHITAYCSFLKEDYAGKFDATGEKYINRLVASAASMQQMIDGLQDVALRAKSAPEED